MKTSYASYQLTLGSLEEVVRTVAELGFGGVAFLSLSGEERHMPSVLEGQSSDEMDNIRNIIEQYELDVHLHIAPMLTQARREGRVFSQDTVDYMESRIRGMVDWLVRTGRCRVISFDLLAYETTDVNPLGSNYRFDLRLMCDILQRTADMVAPFNIKVAYENSIAIEECCLPYDIGRVIEIVNRDNVGILLDIGHANIAVTLDLPKRKSLSLPEYIRAIPAEIVEVHLHDNHGREDEHLNPGEGNIDFESVFSALQDIGFKGNITLESNVPKDEKNKSEYVNNGREAIEELLRG